MRPAVLALPAVLLALACASQLAAPAAAQLNAPASERTFDYNPQDGQGPAEELQPTVETTYEDAEILNHPVYGTIMLYKYRWKNWVARALYLAVINIALMAIILSLSKTEEYNIIISYLLCGASFTVSFWVFLCAVLLMQLNSMSWIYVGPVSFLTAALGYGLLMKVKKYDVSLTELKESFQKLRAASREDPRLASVDGSPGDWPGEDFLR